MEGLSHLHCSRFMGSLWCEWWINLPVEQADAPLQGQDCGVLYSLGRELHLLKYCIHCLGPAWRQLVYVGLQCGNGLELGTACPGSMLKSPGGLVNNKLNVNQQCTLAAKAANGITSGY